MKSPTNKFVSRIFRSVVTVLIVCSLLQGAAYNVLLRDLRDAQASSSESRSMDVAAVFFGDFDEAGGIGPQTRRSILQAVTLYRAGAVKAIACLGGARPQLNVFGSQLAAQQLLAEGVDASDIAYIDNTSYDTTTNVEQLRLQINVQGWRRIAVVSSPFHVIRIRFLLRQSASEAEAQHSEIFLFPSYHVDDPEWTAWGRFWDLQHEVAAWTAHALIPERIYQSILKFSRQ